VFLGPRKVVFSGGGGSPGGGACQKNCGGTSPLGEGTRGACGRPLVITRMVGLKGRHERSLLATEPFGFVPSGGETV